MPRRLPLTVTALAATAAAVAATLAGTPAAGHTTSNRATTTTVAAAATPKAAAVRAVRYEVRKTRFRAFGPVTAPPAVNARAWAVADLDTGRMLAIHRQRVHLPQASTIKVLTALTAADTVARRPDHRVTWREAHPQYCTCAGLKVGRRYTRAALLAGMMLPSGNDAAEALAGSHPRGRRAFMRAMNAKALELGATDTVAVTPSGLTAPGAYSSARDLLIFLRAAQANPVVAPYLDMPSFEFGPRGGRKRTVYRSTDYVNVYAGLHPGTQGKSGYTTPAKNTLVVATPINGRNIGVATLGAPGGYSTSGARALTVWADRNYDALARIGRLLPNPPAND